MAILEYIPPIKKVINHQNDLGDYYRASCEVCGTEFFPKRRSAKYCTPNCKVIQHRIDVANGKIVKEIKKTGRKSNKKTISVRGAINVYKFLKDQYDTRGDKDEILNMIKSMDYEEIYEYGSHSITRKSDIVFEIVK